MLKLPFGVRSAFRSFCSQTAGVLNSFRIGEKVDETLLLRELSSTKDNEQIQRVLGQLSVVSKTWQPSQESGILEIVNNHCQELYNEAAPLTQAHILRILSHWDFSLTPSQRSQFLQYLRKNAHSLPIPLYTQLLEPIGHFFSEVKPPFSIIRALVERGLHFLPEACPDCMVYYLWMPSKCGLSLQELNAEAIPSWFDCSLGQIEQWDGILVSSVLVALSREKLKPPKQWWKVYSERLLNVNEFTEQSCSSMLHSLAKLRLAKYKFSNELVRHVTRHYSEKMYGMGEQGLANGLWGYSKLNFDPKEVASDFWRHYWFMTERNLERMEPIHLGQHLAAWQSLKQYPSKRIVLLLENHLLDMPLQKSDIYSAASLLMTLNKMSRTGFLNLSDKVKRRYGNFLISNMHVASEESRCFSMCAKALTELAPWPEAAYKNYWEALKSKLEEQSPNDLHVHMRMWHKCGLRPPKDLLQDMEKHLMKADLTENVQNFMFSLCENHRFFSNTFLRFVLSNYVDNLPMWNASCLASGLRLFEHLRLRPSSFSSNFWSDYWENFEQTIDSLLERNYYVTNTLQAWHYFCILPPPSVIEAVQGSILRINSLQPLRALQRLPWLMSPELKEHFKKVWEKALDKPNLEVADACSVDAMREIGWTPNDEFWERFYEPSLFLYPSDRSIIQQTQIVSLLTIAISAEVAPNDEWLRKLTNLLNAGTAARLLLTISRSVANPNQMNQAFDNRARARQIAMYLIPAWLSDLDRCPARMQAGVANKGIIALTNRQMNFGRRTFNKWQWSSLWTVTDQHLGTLPPKTQKRLRDWVTEQSLSPPQSWWRKLQSSSSAISDGNVPSSFGTL